MDMEAMLTRFKSRKICSNLDVFALDLREFRDALDTRVPIRIKNANGIIIFLFSLIGHTEKKAAHFVSDLL